MHIQITLPEWVDNFIKNYPQRFISIQERMKFVIDLSKANVENETGGPFAAAIFEKDSGKLISVGVNRVTAINNSVAHAEVVAIMMAEKVLNNFDLSSENFPDLQLVTSSQMCIMCFGAVIWSGVKSVVMGARGEDVEKTCGFDEGPLPSDWVEELNNRGIEVLRDVLRDDAKAVLQYYCDKHSIIYNPSRAKK